MAHQYTLVSLPRFLAKFQVFCFNHAARFEEILGLFINCFAINRKIGWEGVEKNEG